MLYLQVNIPSGQRLDRYPNLFRWFDFMQHTVDPAGHYKRLDIGKPKFQRGPAAPAITPKVPTLNYITLAGLLLCVFSHN